MTLMQHFAELRRRVLWLLSWFVGAFGAGWFLAPVVQEFLTGPLLAVWPDGTLLYTGLADGLMIQFSLATLFAMFVCAPVLLWHIWAFVSPGLRGAEKKIIAPMLIASPVMFLGGAAFAFYVLFPVVFKFFVDLNQSSPVPTMLMPAAKEYLALAIRLLKAFGIAFQLPLVLIILNRIGVLPRRMVVKSRRYAVVGIFILAAILTPPDIVSQCMLALPLWALYEISILFMKKDPAPLVPPSGI